MQVKLHFEKVEAEREAAAIGHLRSMLPKLAEKTLALALGDCKMDVERSLMLLRQFQAENFEHLANLHRKRAREGADEEQDDTHAASSGAESDRSEGSPRARKHKRSDKDKKDKKHKRKSKKEKKKSKRSKRQESPEREARSQFGAHGIIRESDYAIKKPEFLAWAAEHKEIDVESLTRCAHIQCGSVPTLCRLACIRAPLGDTAVVIVDTEKVAQRSTTFDVPFHLPAT